MGQQKEFNNGMEQTSKYIVKSNMVNPHNKQVRPYVLGVMEFNLPAPGGGYITRSFLDDSGEPDILRVEEYGLVWHKNNPIHQKNIALLNDLRNHNWDIKNALKIEDEDTAAMEEADLAIKSADAIFKLREAKEQNNSELMYGLARMFMTNVHDQTLPVVFNFLMKKAQSAPVELLDAMADKDFDFKINVLKAIDLKVIEKTPEGFYTFEGSIIARTFNDLSLYLKENEELAKTIFVRLKGYVSPLSASTRVGVGSGITSAAGTKTESIDAEKAEVQNQNRLLNLTSQVKRWVEAGLFEQRTEGYYYNNIPMGKDNKGIAETLLKNSAIEENLKELYSQTKVTEK